MNTVKIGIRGNQEAFRPGEELHGAVFWHLDKAPKSAEVRLIWFTQGKGTQDIEVMDTVRFDAPMAQETREFSLRLPEAPYSFSGKLISLSWAVELVVKPGGADRSGFVLSPTGGEIDILQLRQESR